MLTPWKKSSDQLRQHIQRHKYYFANKGPSSQSYVFSEHEKYHEKSCMDVRIGPWRQLRTKELTVFKCDVGENSWESLELWRSNQSILKEIIPEYSLEELMLILKFQYFGHLMQRSSSLEKTMMLGKMKAGGDGGDRGWDGWMTSLIQWTWVWENSGSWWWTGKPGVPQSTELQRVIHDWATELNLTEILKRYIRY